MDNRYSILETYRPVAHVILRHIKLRCRTGSHRVGNSTGPVRGPHQCNSTEASFRFRGVTVGFMMKIRPCVQYRLSCSRYTLFLIIRVKYLSKPLPFTNSSRVPLAVR